MAFVRDTTDETASPPTQGPAEAFEGQVVPSGCVPDADESVVAKAGHMAVIVAVGALALAASGPREEPAPLQRLKRRRRSGRGLGHQPSSPPRLPEWLEDLDRVNENTEIQKRRLTDKGWTGFATEGDAIVFLGYLVLRKTATDAAMVLGNEALLGLALRKTCYGEIETGFFSNGVKPITRFDINEPARLAAVLGDRFGSMPLWDKDLYRQQEANLRARIERITAECERRVLEKQVEIRAAYNAVNWDSKKRKRPDQDSYYELKTSRERQIDICKGIIAQAGRALDELLLGKRSPAIDFLHANETH